MFACGSAKSMTMRAKRYVMAVLLGLGFLLDARAARADAVREGPAVLAVAGSGVGELVPDVTFTDLAGKPGRLSEFRGRKATVLCVTSTTCPLSKKYGPTLAALEAAYRERGVEFVLINPVASDTPAQMRGASEGLAAQGFRGRYVPDARGTLTSALRASSTTEVFVLDGALTLVYRGAVDDQYGLGYALPEPKRRFLADALDATLAGEPGQVPA